MSAQNVYSGDYARVAGRPLDMSTDLTKQITVVTAGAAVQGPDLPLTDGVLVYAHPSNTGLTYAGNSSGTISSSTGAVFAAGGGYPIYFAVENVNQLWFNAAVSGEKLFVVKA